MQEHLLVTFAVLGILGSLAQWFAWWVKLPAILFLLLIGILVGPVFDWFNPNNVFGDLLFPIISLSVSVILFEGSLTLKFREIKGLEKVVRNMVTIGVLITWSIITVATRYLMAFEWPLALLFGALVVVTGPTVIVPMLRTVRPTARIANILRWEGIMIDPIGALLAVLVFEFIISSLHGSTGLWHVFVSFGKTLAIGILLGGLFGQALGYTLRRHWLPEYLHNVITLTLVFAVFAGANSLQAESGLLAVTVMGVWLANMKNVPIDDILNFKESLSMLLISGLFIILAARLTPAQLSDMGWAELGIFLVVQFIARPVKVLIATFGSTLIWQERVLLAWIAPRGIIAAAVSALFALRLEEAGFEQAPLLISLTFMVIIGTVVLQSATSRPLAKWLGVAEPEPRGLLIIGANPVARAIAIALKEQGFRTLLTDSHWPNVNKASMEGLEAFWGNAISQRADRNLDLVGIGQLLGLSQNDHLNVLGAQRYVSEFGRKNIFTLSPGKDSTSLDIHVAATEQRGKVLFGDKITYGKLASKIANGGKIKATQLTDEFTFEQYTKAHHKKVIPLFAISARGNLKVFGDLEHPPRAAPGWIIIGLFDNEETAEEK